MDAAGSATFKIIMEEAIILGFNLLNILIPKVEEAIKSGQITPEQQQKVRDAYLQLRALGDGAFAGPEWDPSQP